MSRVEGKPWALGPWWVRAPDMVLVGTCVLGTLTAVAMLCIVLAWVLVQGAPTLGWSFLTQPTTTSTEFGGVFPAIVGTTALTLLTCVVVLPVGVLTAIYMHEYARATWLSRCIRLAIETLAGVPSIVFGLFGLGFFVQVVGRQMDRALWGGDVVMGRPALAWAALTMGLLCLPVVVVSTEEALRAVPQGLRDASLALGATKLFTIRHVVLPRAAVGILTAMVLTISRAAGEVAPILFLGVAYYLPDLPSRLNDPFMHLGYHVYVLATQSPDVDRSRPKLFGTIVVLFALTVVLNSVAVVIRARLLSARKRD